MYKVKYYVTDPSGDVIDSATTYTEQDFDTYAAAAQWLEDESDGFVEACSIDTKNNPECVEIADELAVVRIAPRGENEPIVEIPMLSGIEVKSATQHILEYKNEFHFRFDGHNYQWTQFVGEQGIAEYLMKDGVQVEGGDYDFTNEIFGEDIAEVFNYNHGINCEHSFRQECRRCGKGE